MLLLLLQLNNFTLIHLRFVFIETYNIYIQQTPKQIIFAMQKATTKIYLKTPGKKCEFQMKINTYIQTCSFKTNQISVRNSHSFMHPTTEN